MEYLSFKEYTVNPNVLNRKVKSFIFHTLIVFDKPEEFYNNKIEGPERWQMQKMEQYSLKENNSWDYNLIGISISVLGIGLSICFYALGEDMKLDFSKDQIKNILTIVFLVLGFAYVLIGVWLFLKSKRKRFDVKEKNVDSSRSQIKEGIKYFFKKIIKGETPEEKLSKLIEKIQNEQPGLNVEENRKIIRAYHEIKNIERQKIYYFVLSVLTLANIYLAYQNFLLQKPNFVSIVGQVCPDEYYGYILHTFSFVNVGKSSGSITVGYKNNNSAVIDFREYGGQKEFENPQTLIIKDGVSETYYILATPFPNTKLFNFTLYAQTSDWCIERTCNYKIDDNNPNHLKKIDNDKWIKCI